MLLRIDDIENLDIVRQLLQAHEYWRMKRLAVDLVILNERASSYVQDLQIALEALVRTSQSRPPVRERATAGPVFVLRADLISAETARPAASVARVVLVGQRGCLADQLDRVPEPECEPPASRRSSRRRMAGARRSRRPPPDLEFFNGLGGFAEDGREYVTMLGPGQSTPAPWINVVANPAVSAFRWRPKAAAITWSVNSRENQLTPWSNDPVDRSSGRSVLSARRGHRRPLECRRRCRSATTAATYVARHGRGYSRFEHDSARHRARSAAVRAARRSDQDLAPDAAQSSGRTRRLSVTAYVEWVLGPSRSASAPFVTTEIDPAPARCSRAIPGTPPSGRASPSPISAGARPTGPATGGSSSAATARSTVRRRSASAAPLSQTVGAGLDPCGALRTAVELPTGRRVEIVFFLGEAAMRRCARA